MDAYTGLDEIRIERWDATQARAALAPLCALIIDVVNAGASIGYLMPMSLTEARRFWQARLQALEQGSALLWVALSAEGVPIGTAQLALAAYPNSRHRAEVQKVMVHSAYRQRGIAQALMLALEAGARESSRTLLVLDTRRNDPAERLYQRCGFHVAGVIPAFVVNEQGAFEDTVLYYKHLT